MNSVFRKLLNAVSKSSGDECYDQFVAKTPNPTVGYPSSMKGVQTHTMTIHTDAKVNRKTPRNDLIMHLPRVNNT